MRWQTEFNYMLKIRDGQGLPANPEVGVTYDFEKTIERIYPLRKPIMLIDDDYNAHGLVVVLEFTSGNGITKGKYKIVSLYNEEKRKVMTQEVKEIFALAKQEEAE
jgi:hypothetical protein